MSRAFPFSIGAETKPTDFIARIDATGTDKSALIAEVSKQLQCPFPATNWDGLDDWLCDLSWLEAPRIVLAHARTPHLNRAELKVYLSILANAVTTLAEQGKTLLVSFPVLSRELNEAWSGVTD